MAAGDCCAGYYWIGSYGPVASEELVWRCGKMCVLCYVDGYNMVSCIDSKTICKVWRLGCEGHFALVIQTFLETKHFVLW